MNIFGLIASCVLILIGPIQAFGQPSRGLPVCVISLLPEAFVENHIVNATEEILERMGQGPQFGQIDFKLSLNGVKTVYTTIKSCLEGDYREVILLAHTAEIIEGYPTIVFPGQRPDENHFALESLSDRIFNQINLSPSIRQITLVACDSERVLTRYPVLLSLLHEHDIRLRFAPIDRFLNWVYSEENLRDAYYTSELIAEAAQAPGRDQTFCLLYGQSGLEIGSNANISCLNNTINISFSESIRLPTSGSWFILEKINFAQESHDYLLKFAAPGSGLGQPGKRSLRPLILRADDRGWRLGPISITSQ